MTALSPERAAYQLPWPARLPCESFNNFQHLPKQQGYSFKFTFSNPAVITPIKMKFSDKRLPFKTGDIKPYQVESQ
jgi:hypothetical protein